MTVRVLTGDCRAVLATLPDESVHCVVASPPYWGLRDYKVEPSVWGGDVDCGHEWGDEAVVRGPAQTQGATSQRAGRSNVEEQRQRDNSQGQFCRHCNAWRGVLGLEPSPELHVEHIVEIFRHVRRVLRKDGTLWLNYGDCYANPGHYKGNPGNHGTIGRPRIADAGDVPQREKRGDGLKNKDLLMMPARIALALQADGWWLRSEIVWAKPNPMPESVTDRPTSSHEKMFLLTRSARYFYDAEAVREGNSSPEQLAHNLKYAKVYDAYDERTGPNGTGQPGNTNHTGIHSRPGGAGRNLRNVWHIATHPYPEAHFATFPTKLVEPCIKAGTSEKGVCGDCGAPWVREVETTLLPTKKAAKTFVIDGRDQKADPGDQGSNRQKDGHRPGHINVSKTTGWSPSCECVAITDGPTGWEECSKTRPPDTVPAVVLDPFGGSGTVGLVADRLGRDAILIELNPEYADMARVRIAKDAPLLTEVRQ